MALPQTLGRLTLLQQLGSDTYTVSWLYHDPERDEAVVVRALGDQWSQHPQARADFIGGTGPFQSISSPQYVGVLASGQAPDGTPYVVTPYAAPGAPGATPGVPGATPGAPSATPGAPSGAPTAVGAPSPFAPPGRTPIDLGRDTPTQPPPAPWPAPQGAVPPGAGPGAPGAGPGMPGYGAWTPTPKQRRLWPLIVGIAAVVVLLAAAGIVTAVKVGGNNSQPSAASTPASGSSSPSPTSPASPSGPASPTGPGSGSGGSGATPTVGQCRDLVDSSVPKQSDQTPTVACSQQHTAQTYYIGRYRSGGKPDGTYAGSVCQKQLAPGLGITAEQAALTAYQVLYFEPDNAQWAAGQRWFRCDVALLTGRHLLPLPTKLTPQPLPDSLRACLTKKGVRTPCSLTHLVRAFATYHLGGSKPPSDKAAEAAGRAECPAKSVYFTWPSAVEFRQGIRLGVCWSTDATSAGVPGTST